MTCIAGSQSKLKQGAAMSKAKKAHNLKVVEGSPQLPAETQERPYFAVYTTDTLVDGRTCKPGTWCHDIERTRGGEPGTPVDRRICDPLHVLAETRNHQDGSFGLLVQFTARGKPVELFLQREDLAGRGDTAIRQLIGAGLAVSYRQQGRIAHYLMEHFASQIITVTDKTGWHGKDSFVLPAHTIGSQAVRYRSSSQAANPFTQSGSLEGWQQQVGKYCLGNPVLLASVCCALAGPLLKKTGVRGGGLHLIGKSSSGKSLAQLVAASVWGEPQRFAGSWDTTPNGMEIAATSRNDTVLILDEISRANPAKISAMAYLIANGEGKGTMTREREARQVMSWRVLALSSGEASLADHAKAGGQNSQAGAELRMIDIDAGNRRHRAFDDVHGMAPADFHAKLTRVCSQHYGHLGPAFVDQLLKKSPATEIQYAFKAVRRNFTADNAQAGRIADRFAVMALAGELASQWGLTGWSGGAAMNACALLFAEWLDAAGGGNLEDKRILQALAGFIERFGDSRFSDIDRADQPGSPLVHDRAGYYKNDPISGRQYLFSPAGLALAAPGYSARQITDALHDAGALARIDSEGKRAVKTRIPGQSSTPRFYYVTPEKLYPAETTETHHE